MREDIVKSELAWKDVLQEVCRFVDFFVISNAVQNICQESDANLSFKSFNHTDMRETEVRPSFCIEVRLPVQYTVSHKSDGIGSIDLAAE